MHIRWMIRKDMSEVLAIENDCFEFPWSEDDFVRCLRQRNCIGMVVENAEDKIVGFMIYELNHNDLHLINIAVHSRFRRTTAGSEMIDKLKKKLSQQKRRKITAEVRESNYAAQLFFKSLGFFCTEVIRDCYEDCDESGYRFQYDLCPPVRLLLKNRVTSDAMERRQ